jgi:hypothetical protein
MDAYASSLRAEGESIKMTLRGNDRPTSAEPQSTVRRLSSFAVQSIFYPNLNRSSSKPVLNVCRSSEAGLLSESQTHPSRRSPSSPGVVHRPNSRDQHHALPSGRSTISLLSPRIQHAVCPNAWMTKAQGSISTCFVRSTMADSSPVPARGSFPGRVYSARLAGRRSQNW